MNEQFGDAQYDFVLSDDGESLTIAYRPLFQARYLTGRVLVEFAGETR